MKNKKILILIIIICIIIASISVVIFNINKPKEIFEDYNEKYGHLPRSEGCSFYVLNMSNIENVVDAYPYVFIAKVNKIIGTDYRNPIEREITPDGSVTETIYEPYTLYDISVIENIKGEIIKNKSITIEQSGGVSQNHDYIVFDGNEEFLRENYYYILLPYSPTDTDGLRLEAGHNIIELGELSNRRVKNKVLEIARMQNFEDVEQLYNEKSEIDEINKVIKYKYACMTPIDEEYYKQLAESQGVKDYKTYYFSSNISKYDVKYEE